MFEKLPPVAKNRDSSFRVERFHDLRLVRALAGPEGEAAVNRHCCERGIAFFEYTLQVPANRAGYGSLSLTQLKVLQEVITLAVFVPFAILYMRQPVKTNFLWAGLCLVGAVYFAFNA